MNGPAMALFLAQTKKAQERKRNYMKQKRNARRRFQAYVRPLPVVTQLFVLLLLAYSQLFSSRSRRTKNMGETEGCHVLGGDLSGLEQSRLERKFSNVTSGL